MQIENKVFIVTGGASGLGAATADMLIKAGAKVMLVDLNAEAVAAQVSSLGKQANSFVADISQPDAAQAAVDATVNAFGALNGLVNCAGIVRGEKILGKNGPHALDSFSQVINVNLIGSFNMLRLGAAAIAHSNADVDGERGVIINTASVAAFDGQIGQSAYAASKGAMDTITKGLSLELAADGIRVNGVRPGYIYTQMHADGGEPGRVSRVAEQLPMKRGGEPEEIAEIIIWLLSNSSSYVTGSIIDAAGGR